MHRFACALIGTLAMAMGIWKFAPLALAIAAHAPHHSLLLIARLALWALLFETGALLLGCGILDFRKRPDEAAMAPMMRR